MADPNPLAGMPLAASLASNMNDSLQWMSRLWSGAATGGAAPGVPSMLMPTFDPDELEKRIADLKTVAHWLDMNRALLQSTIQTLEMQRNTLLAMQAVTRPPMPGPAPASAPPPASASAPASAPGKAAEVPPFDPSAWWNMLQDQFARVAATAINEAPPAASGASAAPGPSGPSGAAAPSAGPQQAAAAPKAAAAANRKPGGAP